MHSCQHGNHKERSFITHAQTRRSLQPNMQRVPCSAPCLRNVMLSYLGESDQPEGDAGRLPSSPGPYLTIEEAAAMSGATLSPLLPLLFLVNTGTRPGELCGLTWEDLDLRHGAGYLPKTKTGKPRWFYIPASLVPVLKKTPRNEDDRRVFHSTAP